MPIAYVCRDCGGALEHVHVYRGEEYYMCGGDYIDLQDWLRALNHYFQVDSEPYERHALTGDNTYLLEVSRD